MIRHILVRTALLFAVVLASLPGSAPASTVWTEVGYNALPQAGRAAIPLPDGRSVLVGTIRTDAGDNDALVVFLGADGELINQHMLGTTREDEAVDVALIGGDVVVLGNARAKSTLGGDWDVWLMRFSPMGMLLGASTYGGGAGRNDIGHAVIEGHAGQAVVVGESTGLGTVPTPRLFALGLNSAGSILWQMNRGGTEGAAGYDAVRTAGGYLLAGAFADAGVPQPYLVEIGPAGAFVSDRRYESDSYGRADSIALAPDGGVFLGGAFQLNGIAGGDAWVAHIAPDKSVIWERRLGDSLDLGTEEVVSVAAAPGGSGVYGAGFLRGSPNGSDAEPWLFALDGSGNFLWQKMLDAPSWDTLASVATTPEGGLLFAGVRSMPGLGNEAWALRTDSKGALSCGCGTLSPGTTVLAGGVSAPINPMSTAATAVLSRRAALATSTNPDLWRTLQCVSGSSCDVCAAPAPCGALSVETTLVDAPTQDLGPDISATHAIWMSYGAGNYTVFLKDLAGGPAIPIAGPDTTERLRPTVGGDFAAWEQGGIGIVVYKISTGQYASVPDVPPASRRQTPEIDGRFLVWSEDDAPFAGRFRLRSYDLTRLGPTPTILPGDIVDLTSASSDHSPLNARVADLGGSDPRVVWSEFRTLLNDWRIFLYDAGSVSEIDPSPGAGHRLSPDLWQNLVVWQEHFGTDTRIVLRDLSASSSIVLPDTAALTPVIHKNLIVWYTTDGDCIGAHQFRLHDLATGRTGTLADIGDGHSGSELEIYDRNVVLGHDGKNPSFNFDYDLYWHLVAGACQP